MDKKITDWDSYYAKPYKSAKLTRRFTGSRLRHLIEKFVTGERSSIAELGGGNSGFYPLINKLLTPKIYHMFDNNKLGLKKLAERLGSNTNVHCNYIDLLNYQTIELRLDFVYSIGLIEHFEKPDTKKIIEAHFHMLKPGGIALITFPTPTILYKLTRKAAEITGLWIFHDERPLQFDEVKSSILTIADILHEEVIWPIFLTQGVIVAKKK